ncbi:MAG: aldo/keto reductase [Actinomycetaceae bacterium]|nr:aldo/keto reductase [Actinomycetaceae bacterium]MDU0970676.1 aldo/keto reductase [Actinomycetaceae bacterium]
MKYTTLGTSGITVSRICLGAMGFGDPATGQHSWTVDQQATRAIVAHALEQGITFFDTAPVYQAGSSERYLGAALREIACRDGYVLATKVPPRTDDEIARGVDGAAHVEASLDASLARLGVDFVDLFICHMWDYRTPIEELLEGFDRCVRSGKARAIGMSNCFAWQLARANDIAAEHGWAQFVSFQGHYNLLAREDEREMVPLCRADGIALTPYSALASGRLAKRPGETSKRLREDAYAHHKYDQTAEADARIIERVVEVADRLGVSMSEVALAWLLRTATAPVVGATTLSHVDTAVAACDLELSDADAAYLEELYVPHALVGVMADNHA